MCKMIVEEDNFDYLHEVLMTRIVKEAGRQFAEETLQQVRKLYVIHVLHMSIAAITVLVICFAPDCHRGVSMPADGEGLDCNSPGVRVRRGQRNLERLYSIEKRTRRISLFENK